MTGRFSLLAVVLLLTTGCATMVNGRYQAIDVDSYPSGAAVEVDCGDGPRTAAATTPTKIQVLRASETCQLTFTHPGYEPKTIALTHQPSRATNLNAVFGVPSALVVGIAGAIVGSTVDGADTGFDIGVDAGFALGSGGATALDLKGGGWKWVPANVFVVLTKPDPEAD